MSRQRMRSGRTPGCAPNWNGDVVDRYYAEELRAAGYGGARIRTIGQARRAWEIYHRPWETEDDLRATNDLLAPLWIPYIYANEIHGAVLRELTAVVEHLAPNRMLDTGCGVGFDACFLAARYEWLTVRGTDLSPVMIAQATVRASRRGLANAGFVVAAHRELPACFSGAHFDFVSAHGSLLYRDRGHLREHLSGITGVLRPGGVLLCEMPMAVNPHHFVSEVVGAEVGLSFWTERGEIRTLSVDGEEVCYCVTFQLTEE